MFNRVWARQFMAASVMSILAATAATAGECGHEFCWGAVGAGPDGVAARASGLRTGPAAEARLKQVCLNGCTVAEVFVDGCGAIAQGRSGALSSGFATDRDNAIAEALFLCGGEGNACRLRVWACSN